MRVYAADVDGDAATDHVITYLASGYANTRVVTSAGIVSTISWADQVSNAPLVERLLDLDGVPGVEVVVRNGQSASSLHSGLITWEGRAARDLGVSLADGGGVNHLSGSELADLDGDGRAEVSQRFALRIGQGDNWIWSEQQWTFHNKRLFLTGVREARSDRPKNSPLERPTWLRPVPARPAQSPESAFEQFLLAWARDDQHALADYGGVDSESGVMAVEDVRRVGLSPTAVERLRHGRLTCATRTHPVLLTPSALCTISANGGTVSAVVQAGSEEVGTSSLWLVRSVNSRDT